MKKLKKLSVIIPCYNVEKYISKCLQSLRNQTYKNLEIIVINDGSKDSTLDVIKKEVRNDKRFKVIDQTNHGIGYTRNKGISLATGEYIAFVDSDDYLEKDMYEKMIQNLESNNADIVICDYYKFNSKEKESKKCGKQVKFNLSIFESPEIINNVGYCPWNKVYKTKLFKNIKFPLNKKFEDLEAVVKVLSEANKISKINDYLYNYRVNENGETCTINKRDLDILDIIKNTILYLKQKENYKKIESEVEIMCLLQLYKSLLSAFKVCTIKETLDYIDDMFEILDSNFDNWKKSVVYSNDSFITKFIKQNKIIYKLFAILKILKRKITK